VLNALRHQRLGNSIVIQVQKTYQSVLNALRHQRLGNSRPFGGLGMLLECSTPCGINGWETMSRVEQN